MAASFFRNTLRRWKIHPASSKTSSSGRNSRYVTLGVSPRGALAVTRAAKANAYLEGRDYVIPDDVCAVFPDVCVHRLILNSKARLQDYTAALILQNVLTSVQKPDIREFSSK